MAFNPKSPEGHTAWDYAQAIINYLAGIQKAIEDGRGDTPVNRRIPFNIQCDASGNGELELTVSRGTSWELNGIGFHGGNSGYLALYVNDEVGTNLLYVANSATIVTDSFDDSAEVSPDDDKLLIVVRNEVANQVVSGNLRITQYDTNPNAPKDANG